MCFVPRPRDGRRRRHARVRVKAVTATPRDTGPLATRHGPHGRAMPTRRPDRAVPVERRLGWTWSAWTRVYVWTRTPRGRTRQSCGNATVRRPVVAVGPSRRVRHGPAGPRGRLISFNRRKPAQNVWIFSHGRQKDRGNAAGPQRSLELACVWQRSDRRHQNNERRNYPPPPQIHRSREHRWAAISGRGCQDFTS
jgi:hypothetical protein